MEQLLKILEDNARLPIEDIATMLNKSPAEVAAMIDLARALLRLTEILIKLKLLVRKLVLCLVEHRVIL